MMGTVLATMIVTGWSFFMYYVGFRDGRDAGRRER